jgi:hypothetical protein
MLRKLERIASSSLLKEREGGYAFALNVSSAQQTAAILRAKNMGVAGPVDAGLWQTVAITTPALPFQPMFFIEYAPREGASRSPHRNMAVRLHSVCIAVKDLLVMAARCQTIGLQAGRRVLIRKFPRTAAKIVAGRGEFSCSSRTTRPGRCHPTWRSTVKGVVGASIEVRDVQAARLTAGVTGSVWSRSRDRTVEAFCCLRRSAAASGSNCSTVTAMKRSWRASLEYMLRHREAAW